MSGRAVRADPGARLPGRVRPRTGIGAACRVVVALSLRAVARLPLLFLGATAGWGLVRFLCRRAIVQAHGGAFPAAALLGGAGAALAVCAWLLLVGPLAAAAVVMPAQFRLILAAPAPAWGRAAARAGKSFAALLGLATLAVLIGVVWAGIPLILRPRLGGLSTRLTVLLLLPAAVLAWLCLARWLTGLPALAIGLPRGLAEGWAIGRRHAWRIAGACVACWLPVAALQAAWVAGYADPLGAFVTLMLPIAESASIALTASCLGHFYAVHRLPLARRPDRRPSRHPAQRRDPVLTAAGALR